MAINNRRELNVARICTFVTLIALVGLFISLFAHGHASYIHHRRHALLETVLFGTVMFFVAYGNLLYQICLVGYYKRQSKHRPASRAALESMYAGDAPSLSILIPSYKEEYTVNLQTMISAALSEYPQKNVVLLIDDPYRPGTQEDMRALESARRMPGELQKLFDAPLARFRTELEAFQVRMDQGRIHSGIELNRLSMLYDEVADWLDRLTADFVKDKSEASLTHVDRFYLDTVIGGPARAHRERAQEYRLRIYSGNMPAEDILIQYQRLVGLFNVSFSGFERKKYANLSHEANKAMNLNSYIALVGKSWKEVETHNGIMLELCAPHQADFTIPAADFINTIDADSMMLSDYALRLVHMMQQPENKRVAVIQSPCSSYPGAQGAIERAAGAAIDLQYKMHQGYTHWNATFWVGANAMLRHTALQDIREVKQVNGYNVSIYIQDNTVIEDTESSIDLIHKGWELRNYPERMTFSSMPSDFGSLLIQRRRWANGGLLILPKLFSYVLRAPKRMALCKELFMRFHYLASTTTGCLMALLFVFYPFSDKIDSLWIPMASLPCIILYLRDLRNTGYKFADFLRICTLNILLLPVVMGGVLKSLEQMMTGKKIPFSRTPKVPGRTAAPALYSALAAALPFICMGSAWVDVRHHYMVQGVITFTNSVFFLYALLCMIGVKPVMQDIAVGIKAAAQALELRVDELLMPVRRLVWMTIRSASN